MKEFEGKFLGSMEVISVEATEKKTPRGSAIYKITFSDKTSRPITEKALMSYTTDEATDASYVQDAIYAVLEKAIIEQIAEYDIQYMFIPSLMKRVETTLMNASFRAINWLWKKDDLQYAPGFDPINQCTLLEAINIVEDIPVEKRFETLLSQEEPVEEEQVVEESVEEEPTQKEDVDTTPSKTG